MKLVALLASIASAGCQPPAAPKGPPAPPGFQFTLVDLVGGWRWLYKTDEAETSRVEEEVWRFKPSEVPAQLVGRYVRTVEVRSTDRFVFGCNQRPWYRQRAVFDVTAETDGDHFAIKETGYRTEPSPCDHGFRHPGDYTAKLVGGRLALHFDGGTQTLWQLDSKADPLPDAPWSPAVVTGPWRWNMVSLDESGNIRDETEWWEITKRTDTRLDVTYKRRVTVRSPDGSPIACANGPSWTFDDAYVLEGQREEEHWRFVEVAVDPGDHACLRATPHRNLDEATAEQLGDYLVLEWRGKRRQILYRPDV
jgi:hypothetical protein